MQLKNETSIAKVASDVAPSVVSITTKSGAGLSSKQGAGTGIVVSEDGYVITNKHVIKNASDIAVTTSDGLIFDNIKTIGEDPLNDVAFLKINGAKKLKPAKLGNSSTLQIGQNVVAIGNTLGLYQNTVTSGIVSGLGRPAAASSQSGGSAESLNDLIQTDTAINPGNSGGPLVNLAGQVIGINTAIVSNAQGIGFAIPIDVVKGMLEGVLKKGKLERAYLGVRYGEITPAIAKQRNLSTNRGALVAEDGVESGGPADKAGIRPGDIITSRLLQSKIEKEQAKLTAERRSLIGSGDRSEKIRTYNFPQDRITDHRISYSRSGIPQAMDGNINDLTEHLQSYERELLAKNIND